MAGLEPVRQVICDPVVAAAGAVLIAVIFASAALHKLRDRDGFAGALAAYRLLPRALVPAASLLLPLAELLIAAAVCLSASRGTGMALAATLLALYAGAMATNLVRGRRDIDCGCGGVPQRLGWPLVARNLLLVLPALAWTLPALERPLGRYDYLAGLAASIGLWGVWRVSEQLIQQGARLRALRAADSVSE